MTEQNGCIPSICPPEQSVECEPEIIAATATRFELLNKKKPRNFIVGELFRGGELEFWIENMPKDGTGCPGWWMFNKMMEHLGANVTLIIGYWVSGDNLAKVNSLTAAAGGLSLEEACKQTKTGIYASSWGFVNIEVVHYPQSIQGTRGTKGNYSRVFVKFKQ